MSEYNVLLNIPKGSIIIEFTNIPDYHNIFPTINAELTLMAKSETYKYGK